MKVINLPKYHDFVDLRRTPAQVRQCLEEMGHDNVVLSRPATRCTASMRSLPSVLPNM